ALLESVGRVIGAGWGGKERTVSVRRVVEACCVLIEGLISIGRGVFGIGGKERSKTGGRVAVGGGVGKERNTPVGRVALAGCVVLERFNPVGRVAGAGGVEKERESTVGRVVSAGCVAKERTA